MSIAACLIIMLLLIKSAMSKVLGGFSNAPIACDFEKYPEGCEDMLGSYCDLESSRCLCKKDHPIRLFKYCLKYVGINETCYTSRQCNETLNAACYILGTEYDHSGGHNVGFQLSDWPEGKCKCRLGHQFDIGNGTCIKRTIGSWCNTDRDCTKENFHSFCNKKTFICECVYGYIHDRSDDSCSPQRLYGSKCSKDDDCSRDQLICTLGRCKCPKGSHMDAIYPGNLCKPNNDSACNYGYKWDTEKERCVLKIFHPGIKDRSNDDDDGNGDDDDGVGEGSLSLTSILVISIVNILIVLVIIRYCYIRKREESEDDLAERGHIRPTHTLKSYYGDHLILPPAPGSALVDTNGIKCSLDQTIDETSDEVKCLSSYDCPLAVGVLDHCPGQGDGDVCGGGGFDCSETINREMGDDDVAHNVAHGKDDDDDDDDDKESTSNQESLPTVEIKSSSGASSSKDDNDEDAVVVKEIQAPPIDGDNDSEKTGEGDQG